MPLSSTPRLPFENNLAYSTSCKHPNARSKSLPHHVRQRLVIPHHTRHHDKQEANQALNYIAWTFSNTVVTKESSMKEMKTLRARSLSLPLGMPLNLDMILICWMVSYLTLDIPDCRLPASPNSSAWTNQLCKMAGNVLNSVWENLKSTFTLAHS